MILYAYLIMFINFYEFLLAYIKHNCYVYVYVYLIDVMFFNFSWIFACLS